jgi:hypothetical protein
MNQVFKILVPRQEKAQRSNYLLPRPSEYHGMFVNELLLMQTSQA